jgi:type IV pilus assembly protein PilQ
MLNSLRVLVNNATRNSRQGGYFLCIVALILLLVAELSRAENITLVDPNASLRSGYQSNLVDIEFMRKPPEVASVVLTFSNNDFSSAIQESSSELNIMLPATALAEGQLAVIDVREFGTNVSKIESFREKGASRIALSIAPPFSWKSQQNHNQLVVDIVTLSSQQAAQKQQQSRFKGEPIALDFQDIPVRQVLQIIAKVNGFNLVTTDTVTGNVTLSLSGVPWDQALDMILKIRGLDKRMEGNILLVAPTEELTARETQQLQSRQQVAELAPLRSENIQINYAKAAELAEILKSSGGGIVNSRGSVSVDERTNTLLIRDTQTSIDEARKMIQALDIPIKQVLIESRMVTVRDNVEEQLGVRWGFSDLQDNLSVSGSAQGADILANGSVPELNDRLNVNLPVANAAGRLGLQVARLMDGTILDLELSALETENKGEIIASPRITVANQHEAYIEQGQEIPYVQATSSGATSVTFKKAVLSLKVTPHITPDNRIILDLIVTQDTRGETVSTSTGPAVAIDTQEISTQVLVDNGETIVLGGIFQQTSTDDIAKVLLLGDIPLVGNLFKSTQVINEKRELLIFVTPKIVTDAL